ncbi:hypothetical protein F5883DRAFT_252739 [Diaporthe sp. PMI_573]|nr:hypothetical protein F5883DRAFT_252739 [Diaporthaceae sp. PMI_573]
MKSTIFALLTTGALAAMKPHALFSRQVRSEYGQKDCGEGRIPLSYTCCPDQSSGCPATEQCWLGTNGQYGCCPLGETCSGPGGANTQISFTASTSTSTSTSTIDFTNTLSLTSSIPTVTPEPTTTSTSTLETETLSTEPETTSTTLSTNNTASSVGTTSTFTTGAPSPSSTFVTAGAALNQGARTALKVVSAVIAGALML